MASYPDFKWRTIKLRQLDEDGLGSKRLASAVYTDSAANERTHLDRKPFGRFNNNDPEKATGQVCRASLSLSPGARTRLCCIATRRLSVSPACFAPGYTWEPPLQFQDEGLPCLLPVAAHRSPVLPTVIDAGVQVITRAAQTQAICQCWKEDLPASSFRCWKIRSSRASACRW